MLSLGSQPHSFQVGTTISPIYRLREKAHRSTLAHDLAPHTTSAALQGRCGHLPDGTSTSTSWHVHLSRHKHGRTWCRPSGTPVPPGPRGRQGTASGSL